MQQTTIIQFETNQQVENLKYKLSLCGRICTKNYYCRKDQSHEHLIKSVVSPFFCEVRYCSHPDCLVERFASLLDEFNSIKRLQLLNNLWHFTVGFPLITVEQLQNDFGKIKKRHEKIMMNFFRTLKKKGLIIQGIRVLDFSFMKVENGMIYPHYHFGCVPLAADKRRTAMILIKDLEKSMNKKMLQQNAQFHFQSYGYKSKQAIFSYLAKRCIGLFKYDESKNLDYSNLTKGKLKQDILNNVYFHLSQILTEKQYIKHFYKRRHYVTFGGLPHGSIPTDNSLSERPTECDIHGELAFLDVRLEIIFENMNKPPEIPSILQENIVVEIVKIRANRNI